MRIATVCSIIAARAAVYSIDCAVHSCSVCCCEEQLKEKRVVSRSNYSAAMIVKYRIARRHKRISCKQSELVIEVKYHILSNCIKSLS